MKLILPIFGGGGRLDSFSVGFLGKSKKEMADAENGGNDSEEEDTQQTEEEMEETQESEEEPDKALKVFVGYRRDELVWPGSGQQAGEGPPVNVNTVAQGNKLQKI